MRTGISWRMSEEDGIAYDTTLMYAQTLFSIVAWTVLAIACARSANTRWARLALFACPLILSVTSQVALWNYVALSESFALSCLALFVAFWVLFLQRRNVIWAVAIGVTALFLAGVRDSNYYLMPMISVALVLGLLVRPVRRDCGGLILLIAIWLGLVFIAMDVSANLGERWKFSFYNNVGQRILPVEEHTQEFRSLGMPVNDALMERSGKWASSDERAFYNDERLWDFRDWTDDNGKDCLHDLSDLKSSVRDLCSYR